MSDMYRELLIKKEPGISDKLLKAGLILATVLAAAAVLFTPWAILILTALCFVDYFKFPSFHMEFEYLYVNGELDVDKIMAKTTRKRAASYDMKNMEMLALWDSHPMDSYRNNQRTKVVDFSSGRAGAPVYAMVYDGEKGTEVVLFEPDEIILDDICRIAPQKVHIGK